MITFRVDGTPVPQPRPRRRKYGKGVYNPATADPYKLAIKLIGGQSIRSLIASGPVKCHIEFVFPRPQSMIWKTKPMPRVLHCKKPDADNLTKAVFDALNEVAWDDDSQIALFSCVKWIAGGHESAHTLITITEVDDETIPAQERV